MDKALDLRAVFALDRHHKAPVAHGDQGVLQKFALGRGFNQVIQPLAHPQLCLVDLAAQVDQFRACAVGQLLLGEDGVVDGVFQLLVGNQHLKQAVQRGAFPLAAFAPVLDRADVVQHGRNIHQFPQRKVGAFLRFAQRRFTVFQLM